MPSLPVWFPYDPTMARGVPIAELGVERENEDLAHALLPAYATTTPPKAIGEQLGLARREILPFGVQISGVLDAKARGHVERHGGARFGLVADEREDASLSLPSLPAPAAHSTSSMSVQLPDGTSGVLVFDSEAMASAAAGLLSVARTVAVSDGGADARPLVCESARWQWRPERKDSERLVAYDLEAFLRSEFGGHCIQSWGGNGLWQSFRSVARDVLPTLALMSHVFYVRRSHAACVGAHLVWPTNSMVEMAFFAFALEEVLSAEIALAWLDWESRISAELGTRNNPSDVVSLSRRFVEFAIGWTRPDTPRRPSAVTVVGPRPLTNDDEAPGECLLATDAGAVAITFASTPMARYAATVLRHARALRVSVDLGR